MTGATTYRVPNVFSLVEISCGKYKKIEGHVYVNGGFHKHHEYLFLEIIDACA